MQNSSCPFAEKSLQQPKIMMQLWTTITLWPKLTFIRKLKVVKKSDEHPEIATWLSVGVGQPFSETTIYFPLQEYSEISGQLKHLIFLTPVDVCLLKKLMFKIPVEYDFTLGKICRIILLFKAFILLSKCTSQPKAELHTLYLIIKNIYAI